MKKIQPKKTYIRSDAMFSNCRQFRYALWRIWSNEAPYALFICLNPSTADEILNDPTVTRCINFSFDWGYGGLCMANVFAYRATDPKVMKTAADPIGPENNHCLLELCSKAGIIIAAWGIHGTHLNRGDEVLKLVSTKFAGKLHCLGKTKNMQPKHPLYLSKKTIPQALYL